MVDSHTFDSPKRWLFYDFSFLAHLAFCLQLLSSPSTYYQSSLLDATSTHRQVSWPLVRKGNTPMYSCGLLWHALLWLRCASRRIWSARTTRVAFGKCLDRPPACPDDKRRGCGDNKAMQRQGCVAVVAENSRHEPEPGQMLHSTMVTESDVDLAPM